MFHKIQIISEPGELSHGGNTKVLLDGKEIQAYSIKIEAVAGNLTKVTIVMDSEVEISVTVDIVDDGKNV